jgi:archaellum biogenesis protein FlaJ (TadC family)
MNNKIIDDNKTIEPIKSLKYNSIYLLSTTWLLMFIIIIALIFNPFSLLLIPITIFIVFIVLLRIIGSIYSLFIYLKKYSKYNEKLSTLEKNAYIIKAFLLSWRFVLLDITHSKKNKKNINI